MKGLVDTDRHRASISEPLVSHDLAVGAEAGSQRSDNGGLLHVRISAASRHFPFADDAGWMRRCFTGDDQCEPVPSSPDGRRADRILRCLGSCQRLPDDEG